MLNRFIGCRDQMLKYNVYSKEEAEEAFSQVLHDTKATKFALCRKLQLKAKSWRNHKPDKIRKLETPWICQCKIIHRLLNSHNRPLNLRRLQILPLLFSLDNFLAQIPYIMHRMMITYQLKACRSSKHHKKGAQDQITLKRIRNHQRIH